MNLARLQYTGKHKISLCFYISYTWNTHTHTHKFGQLVFDKDAKAIQWRKDNLLNKWHWNNWMCKCKNNNKKQLEAKTYIIFKKFNINYSTRCKIWKYKPLEENIGENLCDLGLDKEFLGMTSKEQSIKTKLTNWNL